MIPKVGQWLHASCSDEWYGPILRVGKDDCGYDVLDIRLPLNDFLSYDKFGDPQDADGPHSGNYPSTRASVENKDALLATCDFLEERGMSDAAAELRRVIRNEILFMDVQWRPSTGRDDCINLNAPGDGCYRCTELFSVHDEDRFSDEWYRDTFPTEWESYRDMGIEQQAKRRASR